MLCRPELRHFYLLSHTSDHNSYGRARARKTAKPRLSADTSDVWEDRPAAALALHNTAPMPTRTSTVALLAVLVLGFASTSSAQQTPPPFKAKPPAPGLQPATQTTVPTYDLTFGYQVLHVPDTWFPFGLNVDGARNFGALSLLGDVGWAFKSEDDVKTHVWHFAAGPELGTA